MPCRESNKLGFENPFLLVLMGGAEIAMLPHPVPFVNRDHSSDGGKLAADIQGTTFGHSIDCLCGLPDYHFKNQIHVFGSVSPVLTGSVVLKS